MSIQKSNASLKDDNGQVPSFNIGKLDKVCKTAVSSKQGAIKKDLSAKPKEPNTVEKFEYVPMLFPLKLVKQVTGGVGWHVLSPKSKKRINCQLETQIKGTLAKGISITNNNFYGNIDKI